MGPPVMETPEPATAAAASSTEPATESAWERGLRHAKQVLIYELAELLCVAGICVCVFQRMFCTKELCIFLTQTGGWLCIEMVFCSASSPPALQ